MGDVLEASARVQVARAVSAGVLFGALSFVVSGLDSDAPLSATASRAVVVGIVFAILWGGLMFGVARIARRRSRRAVVAGLAAGASLMAVVSCALAWSSGEGWQAAALALAAALAAASGAVYWRSAGARTPTDPG